MNNIFSQNQSANNTFSHGLSAKRTCYLFWFLVSLHSATDVCLWLKSQDRLFSSLSQAADGNNTYSSRSYSDTHQCAWTKDKCQKKWNESIRNSVQNFILFATQTYTRLTASNSHPIDEANCHIRTQNLIPTPVSNPNSRKVAKGDASHYQGPSRNFNKHSV